ncbi:unnamed protein product, partial [Coregonus sp. 'balchen']
ETRRLYKQKLEEVSKLQDSCSHAIARQRNKLKELTVLYLSLVLGIVNVTLLNKHSKFTYKDEYEKFKLETRRLYKQKLEEVSKLQDSCSHAIALQRNKLKELIVLYLSLVLGIVNVTLLNKHSKALDAHFNFLLVWYYCTLTIRESILISNGSSPEGILYQMFRNQFLAYCLYQSFVQFLQYYYQSGCLYRLRALGESHNMDLPFWQLYNVLTLFRMAQLPECRKWQVFMCGCSYLVLFMGNFSTTLGVVYHKYIHNIEKDNWT